MRGRRQGGFPPSTSPTSTQQHFRQPSRFERRLYTQNSEMLNASHQLLFGSKIRRKVTSKGRDSWRSIADFHREHNMSRFLVLVLLTAMTALGTEVTTPTGPSNQTTLATFNKDVLPVLQKNCQTCHRSGGVAPMSFTSYESTRPWAKAIKAAVINKKMPPWFADPHVGEFRNAPQLTQADINTLAGWADNGAAEGNAADKPKTVEFIDGWRIQPDVVVSCPHRIGLLRKVRERSVSLSFQTRSKKIPGFQRLRFVQVMPLWCIMSSCRFRSRAA